MGDAFVEMFDESIAEAPAPAPTPAAAPTAAAAAAPPTAAAAAAAPPTAAGTAAAAAPAATATPSTAPSYAAAQQMTTVAAVAGASAAQPAAHTHAHAHAQPAATAQPAAPRTAARLTEEDGRLLKYAVKLGKDVVAATVRRWMERNRPDTVPKVDQMMAAVQRLPANKQQQVLCVNLYRVVNDRKVFRSLLAKIVKEQRSSSAAAAAAATARAADAAARVPTIDKELVQTIHDTLHIKRCQKPGECLHSKECQENSRKLLHVLNCKDPACREPNCKKIAGHLKHFSDCKGDCKSCEAGIKEFHNCAMCNGIERAKAQSLLNRLDAIRAQSASLEKPVSNPTYEAEHRKLHNALRAMHTEQETLRANLRIDPFPGANATVREAYKKLFGKLKEVHSVLTQAKIQSDEARDLRLRREQMETQTHHPQSYQTPMETYNPRKRMQPSVSADGHINVDVVCGLDFRDPAPQPGVPPAVELDPLSREALPIMPMPKMYTRVLQLVRERGLRLTMKDPGREAPLFGPTAPGIEIIHYLRELLSTFLRKVAHRAARLARMRFNASHTSTAGDLRNGLLVRYNRERQLPLVMMPSEAYIRERSQVLAEARENKRQRRTEPQTLGSATYEDLFERAIDDEISENVKKWMDTHPAGVPVQPGAGPPPIRIPVRAPPVTEHVRPTRPSVSYLDVLAAMQQMPELKSSQIAQTLSLRAMSSLV